MCQDERDVHTIEIAKLKGDIYCLSNSNAVYIGRFANDVLEKRQLRQDVERLHNVIKENRHYADILSATIDSLQVKIDVLEANNIKPLNRSKRK
jgi:hypothetical protein